MSVQMREVIDMNKNQWYNRKKTTNAVARNYTNLSQKEERPRTGNQNKEKQGSLGLNVMRMHEEQDICNMYRNKINNKTSRGTTWSGYCKDTDT